MNYWNIYGLELIGIRFIYIELLFYLYMTLRDSYHTQLWDFILFSLNIYDISGYYEANNKEFGLGDKFNMSDIYDTSELYYLRKIL